MDIKNFIKKLGFQPKENTVDIYFKKYKNSYIIELDFKKQIINFGNQIIAENKATQNFSQPENFVVLECVDRLLEKGYKPKNIILEKTWASGHGTSGRLDICVTRDDGSEYLLIECKTYGKEFQKEFARMKKDGGQLFTYFKFSNKADLLMLYASELRNDNIVYKNEIVKIEDDYRTGDVKDFYEKWTKLTKDNGVFNAWVNPYAFVSRAITPKQLKPIQQEDSNFIFIRFLEILRNNVVSDEGNAFNKIFTLFLCKVYDEKSTKPNEELKFQWFEGKDDDVSFQLRLTDLYKNGMLEFLEKEVSDFSEGAFENKFKHLKPEDKKELLSEIHKLRLEKNNEFAIKEVFDHQSFKENAKVVKQVVELLQDYRIRYNKRQQYLSDFFELLLTTGLKQKVGQFFTPVPIAQFIIKSLPLDTLVNKKLEESNQQNLLPNIIDYAAGSGHFLTESMHEIQRFLDAKNPNDYRPDTAKKLKIWKSDHFDWATQYVYGIEKDYRLVKVGKVGCYLHGDGLANVILSDGLANFSKTKEYKGLLKKSDADFPNENKQFDVVLSNPPYSVPAFKINSRDYYTEKDFDLYNELSDQSPQIEVLFIERTKQLLKDGGIAGIILPSSILSGKGNYTKARALILQHFTIVAIAEFGSNTFMATGTNTVTLFLKRKNNYDAINIKNAVNTFCTTLTDVTINGIENPVAKYIQHVWEGISFNDYKTLLQKTPNKKITEHEIYKEYKKKLKAKTEDSFWKDLLAIENEKRYYFIITYNQKIVLVKTGDKNDEKKFLGYSFSDRRGSQGIHAMQKGKNIEDCTQLFDPNIFDNPTKASTYIYKAFNGDLDFEIHKSLQKNVFKQDLVDMLTFNRVDFEKEISLSTKKKVKITSKWEIVKIDDICEVGRGRVINKREISANFGDYPVYSSQTSNDGIFGFLNTYDFEGEYVTWTTDGIYAGSVFYRNGRFNCTNVCGTLKSISNKIDMRFLSVCLPLYTNDYVVKVANPKLMNNVMASIKIPQPPINIQQKIVKEIEVLESKVQKIVSEIENLKNESNSLFNFDGKIVNLIDITSKIGSGATPRGGQTAYKEKGIHLIRSQNIYDNKFHKKGLVFIDDKQAKKLDNVTVLENDILFNITGASVCRCCIVENEYLPARVNQHVSIIRVNEKALPKFVQQLLISDKYKSELLELASNASTREAITKQQLEDFKISLPPLKQQQKIVSEIEKIEVKITALEKEIANIPKEKEAILKKYL